MKNINIIYIVGTTIFTLIIAVLFLSNSNIFTAKVIDEKSEKCNFLRGDSDNSGSVDLTDPVYVLNYLFRGAQPPKCLDAADANDDGNLDITDAVYILNYLFQGSQEPKPPFPDKGTDLTEDSLTCNEIPDLICSIQSINLCGTLGIQTDDSCFIQVYSQTRITEEGIDNDIVACPIKKKGSTYAGCGPYETANDKEIILVQSRNEQRNPVFYNSEKGLVIAWEEIDKEGIDSGKRKLYLCNLKEFIEDPHNYCGNNKIFVAYGFNPSISKKYLVWENERDIEACDLSLSEGPYSCFTKSKKILIATKEIENDPEFATPLIKESYILYRDKDVGPAGTFYNLYAGGIVQETQQGIPYGYESYLVDSGKIDLPQPGDITNDGKTVIYAAKNGEGKYDILYKKEGKKIAIASNEFLVASPNVITLYNNELKQRGNYVIWKQAHPGVKYPLQLKLIREENPPVQYKIITSGYSGSHGQFIICQDGICLSQSKIIGKFEDSSSVDSNQNFINQWETCDLNALGRASDDEIRAGLIAGCLKKN